MKNNLLLSILKILSPFLLMNYLNKQSPSHNN